MKAVIHKYPLTDKRTVVEVPAGSEAITVQLQGSVPTVWIEKPVEHNNAAMLKLEKRAYHVIMTGEEFEFKSYADQRYVGTIQNAGIVGHVFEEFIV